jgi:N-acetylglutamate synthase-like GNAT family acetyltransferase
MISTCKQTDFKRIYEIINDGAAAYLGIIPMDRWHEPYMTEDELRTQIEEGVEFWGYSDNDIIVGVMGIQYKGEVTLIRHAYIQTSMRNKGIGSKLLEHLCAKIKTPILIGTWADATWAIKFYEKHGFKLLPTEEKDKLLSKHWKIPGRQRETSVVLANY